MPLENENSQQTINAVSVEEELRASEALEIVTTTYMPGEVLEFQTIQTIDWNTYDLFPSLRDIEYERRLSDILLDGLLKKKKKENPMSKTVVNFKWNETIKQMAAHLEIKGAKIVSHDNLAVLQAKDGKYVLDIASSGRRGSEPYSKKFNAPENAVTAMISLLNYDSTVYLQ